MEHPLTINASALEFADNCTTECDISAENLAIAECVLRILDRGIEKIQIATIVPSFLGDKELLKQCLSKSDLERCLKYYNQYMRHAELMQETKQNQLHISLIELIDLFCENRRIRDILPKHISNIPNEHNELINALTQLRKIADVRLKTTATVEMRKEKKIHQIFHDNENTVKNLARQKKQLHDQEINLRWKLAAKQALIKKYEDDLAVKKWENNLKIKQEILKSSHKIKEFHAKSLLKQEHFIESVEKAQATYEKSLRTNFKAEKEVRDEKNKLLLQLQGLLRKYDQTIGDKIHENEELQITYDEQRRELDEFLVEYYRQESEYNELAQAKQDAENAEFAHKLYIFMATRAAKIIQHYWRKYIKSKRKAEGGKSKKDKKEKNKKKK